MKTDTPTTRRCTDCRDELPIERFFRSRHHSGGYTYQCRKCNVVSARRSAYRKEVKADRDAFIRKIEKHKALLGMMIEVLNEP